MHGISREDDGGVGEEATSPEERSENVLFSSLVYSAENIIQDDELGPGVQASCKRDSLFLPSR